MNAETGSAGEYLAAVRKHLADLPPEEVADILADISPQIHEAAAESDQPLAEKLGPPQRYAEELRVAAGFPTAPAAGAVVARIALWGLVVGTAAAVWGGYLNVWVTRMDARTFYGLAEVLLVVALLVLVAGAVAASRLGLSAGPVLALPEVRRARTLVARIPARVGAYLRSVQPGWWLARGVVIAIPVVLVHSPSTMWIVTLLVLAGVAVWSGPKARTDRRWLWLSVPITGFAIGTVVLLTVIAAGHPVTMFGDGAFYFVDPWPTLLNG
jgi:uncharacterized membrane protein